MILAKENLFSAIGTVYCYSNQEAFIAAISNLDDAVYDIAGVIDEHFKISLQIRCRTKLNFGRLSQSDLSKIIV